MCAKCKPSVAKKGLFFITWLLAHFHQNNGSLVSHEARKSLRLKKVGQHQALFFSLFRALLLLSLHQRGLWLNTATQQYWNSTFLLASVAFVRSLTCYIYISVYVCNKGNFLAMKMLLPGFFFFGSSFNFAPSPGRKFEKSRFAACIYVQCESLNSTRYVMNMQCSAMFVLGNNKQTRSDWGFIKIARPYCSKICGQK